jgi:predicted PurR-regulated permease PerM
MGALMESRTPTDLARTTLQLLFLGVLIVSSLWILRPFLVAATWAATIVVATWPLLLRLQGWLGDRRSGAVAVMTTALLLILLVPLYFGIDAIVQNARHMEGWASSLGTLTVPQPPAWVGALPLFGSKLAARWHQLAAASPEEVAARLSPFVHRAILWFISKVGSVGLLVLEFLLTVIVAAILYTNGESVARGADRFAHRLAGRQGENAVHLAAQAIRSVALGVVVTAIAQSAFAAVGLVVAGVPFATVLSVLIFMLCVAQIGPAIVLIPAVIWVYEKSGTAWGSGFLIWSIFCSTFDNFARPMLIKRGANLPLLLIFAGVIGGLIAFGVIGLFIGPVVLAVAYTLLVDWVAVETEGEESRLPPPMHDG